MSTNLQAAKTIDEIAEQLERKAEEIKRQPETRMEALIKKMDFTIERLTNQASYRDSSSDRHMKTIIGLISGQNKYFYTLCGLLVLMVAIFAGVVYIQQERLTKLAHEMTIQPVAKIDTGEGKLAFEKLGEQIVMAAGNTALAVNQNTEERLKAMQDEMMAKINRMMAVKKPKPKKYLKLTIKKPKRHALPMAESNDDWSVDKIEPYVPPQQPSKGVIDFDKNSGKAVVK